MIFNVTLKMESEAFELSQINDLNVWTNSDGSKRYESKLNARTDGIYIKIERNKLQLKCSLQKQFYYKYYGVLDNSGIFTISQARQMVKDLFEKIGISDHNVKITYFEIGLNLPTEHEPTKYIELVKSITAQKELFQDANFKKFRQKTTEKHRTIKKVFKIYDKGFEQLDRKRKSIKDLNEVHKILRVETIYRRQNIDIIKLLSDKYLDKIIHTFLNDWLSIEFVRPITAEKGIKESQRQKAQNILDFGRLEYLNNSKTDYKAGKISEREFRTIREFIRDWDKNKHKYRAFPTIYEIEYKDKINSYFEVVSI